MKVPTSSLAQLAILAILASGRDASAANPVNASLRVEPEATSASCVTEPDLRAQVASRLGYDPFRDDAPLRVRVKVDARARRPRAEIVTQEGEGPPGRRALDEATCEALGDAVATTVAIALDPLASSSSHARTAPPPEAEATVAASAPTTKPPAPAPPPAAAPPPSAPSAPLVPWVGLDATVTFGRTAGAALGGRASVGLVWRALAVAVEGRAEATPGYVQLTPVDRTTWSAFSGGLSLCGRKRVLELCAVGLLGSLQGRAEDVSRPSLKGSLFGAVGPRLGVVVPLTSGVAMRASGELGVPLVRTTFSIDGAAAWTTPAVQGSLALGAEVAFR